MKYMKSLIGIGFMLLIGIMFIFLAIQNFYTHSSRSTTKTIDTQEDTQVMNQPLTGNGCIVLCYHRIGRTEYYQSGKFSSHNIQKTTYDIYKGDFRNELDYLKQHNVIFITPSDLYEYMTKKKPLPKQKCVLITFDDVDESVYQNAFPILQKEHIPFTIFTIMGQIGNTNYKGLDLTNWNEIDNMYKSGLATFGTHTYNLHYENSNGQPPFLNPNNLNLFQQDAQQAIANYKQHFGFAPRYFAYPYGFGTPKTDNVMMNDGYKLIFSLRPGVNMPGDPTFFVKRVLLTYGSWKYVQQWVVAS